LYDIYRHSDLIARTENMSNEDLNACIRIILEQTGTVRKNVELNSTPADYYSKMKLLIIYAERINDNAFLKNSFLIERKLYNKERMMEINEPYKKDLDEIFNEL